MPVGGFRDVGGSIVAAFISMLSEEDLLGTIKDDIGVRHGVRWFPPVWKMIATRTPTWRLNVGLETLETRPRSISATSRSR